MRLFRHFSFLVLAVCWMTCSGSMVRADDEGCYVTIATLCAWGQNAAQNAQDACNAASCEAYCNACGSTSIGGDDCSEGSYAFTYNGDAYYCSNGACYCQPRPL